MSLKATRDEIALKASTVEGVHCTPYYRQTTKAGEALVRMDRIEYPNKFGGVVTWQVIVLLPQELALAEQLLETLLEPLETALSEVMDVRSVTPSELVLADASKVPCVLVSGIRAKE